MNNRIGSAFLILVFLAAITVAIKAWCQREPQLNMPVTIGEQHPPSGDFASRDLKRGAMEQRSDMNNRVTRSVTWEDNTPYELQLNALKQVMGKRGEIWSPEASEAIRVALTASGVPEEETDPRRARANVERYLRRRWQDVKYEKTGQGAALLRPENPEAARLRWAGEEQRIEHDAAMLGIDLKAPEPEMGMDNDVMGTQGE